MRRLFWHALIVVVLMPVTMPRILVASDTDARITDADSWPRLELIPYAVGFTQPVAVANAGDVRLFVVEQAGRVRIVKSGVVLPTPFLDISGRVSCCSERGLLGIAFPPGFAAKQYFYVNYTNLAGATVVSRFQVKSGSPNLADPASEEVILTIAQPYENHNGGDLAFGPNDGYLYIGTGDGGWRGDPQNHGQRTNTLLGKMLRIDVESGQTPYAIPASNPFTQTAGYRGEIWATGLRNPWRFSFDRSNGDLYIADVGQNRYEEVNFQAGSSTGGENYGWRLMEASHCYNPEACDPAGLTLPVAEYDHGQGCAVTGGVVYRGGSFPAMQGLYLYGDYCSGRIWGLTRVGDAWQNQQLARAPFLISAFGEDAQGEVYVAGLNNGVIYRIEDWPPLWLPMQWREP
ncbi:MAG: PQQ-dependent sugar dehydrogenase [Caldilineales bacterium]|nr:PQQ-dependent sugar dehydrogenase [Caldilineales bacterium]